MPQGADDPRAPRPGVRSESSESQKSRSVLQGAGVFDVWIAPYPRDAVPHFAVPAKCTIFQIVKCMVKAPPPGARSNSSGRGSVPWGAEGSLSMFGKRIDLKRARSTIRMSVSAP